MTVNEKFAAQMERELERNAHKGDWQAWRPTRSALVSELRHHMAKLEKAILGSQRAAVSEFSADVANYAVKAFECYGSRAAIRNVHIKAVGQWWVVGYAKQCRKDQRPNAAVFKLSDYTRDQVERWVRRQPRLRLLK